ncbi:MAG: hypothetical protein ABI193_27085 [Minicystis sp.]
MTDENGIVYTLERCVGRGGQGAVWLTRGGRHVVKLLSRGQDREALRRQIAAVKRMNVRDLHVARPLALLRPPEVGYVAEFLEEMEPIGKLLAPPKGTTSVATWYQETGGLRRRLRLLAHAGEALGGLHSRGLIYGDVSHDNVFVSAPVDAFEARLIDLDNLRYESDARSAVYTPGYGAPELVSGKAGPTSLSDAWAFATLAFHVLALVHPFCGDLVTDGEPELEEEAFAGKLPWIDHPTDARNRSSRGIPRATVLGERLAALGRMTFEEGALDRLKRPGVGAWVERLHRAADQTLKCEGCSSTFLVSARACPFCGAARGAFHTVRLQRWEPGRGLVKEMDAVEKLLLAGETLALTRRHTRGESGVGARAEELVLEQWEFGVHVLPRSTPLWVTAPGVVEPSAARAVFSKGTTLRIVADPYQSYVLHFGPLDAPHRVALICGGTR